MFDLARRKRLSFKITRMHMVYTNEKLKIQSCTKTYQNTCSSVFLLSASHQMGEKV